MSTQVKRNIAIVAVVLLILELLLVFGLSSAQDYPPPIVVIDLWESLYHPAREEHPSDIHRRDGDHRQDKRDETIDAALDFLRAANIAVFGHG